MSRLLQKGRGLPADAVASSSREREGYSTSVQPHPFSFLGDSVRTSGGQSVARKEPGWKGNLRVLGAVTLQVP